MAPLTQPHPVMPGGGFVPDRRSGAYQGNEGQDQMLSGGDGVTHTAMKASVLQSFSGTVMQVVPFTRTYMVKVAGEGNIRCRHGLNNSADVACLVPGASVLVNMSPGSKSGVIYGFNPDGAGGGEMTLLPDTVLIGGGPIGISSAMYDIYKNQRKAGGIEAKNERVPTDNLPGDAGMISPYGVGFHIGATSALFRATDTSSIEVHGLDSLVRVHGHNYEQFSAGYEMRRFDDEGEIHHVEHFAKFRAEGVGMTEDGDAFTEEPQDDWGSLKGLLEPKEAAQTGAWRMSRYTGYLGDLERTVVVRQPNTRRKTPAKYGDPEENVPVGLSDVHRLADGALHVRSAKEIIIEKYCLIPAPLQLRMPDDSAGDYSKNYKAGGHLGDGEAPPDQEEYVFGATLEDKAEANKRAAALNEYLAYQRNWYGSLNFVAHKKDWLLPDEGIESDGWFTKKTYIEKDAILKLKDSFWADLPVMGMVDIDARMRWRRYYEVCSKVILMEEGSIILEDGWGSQLTMTRGNIIQTCPGDIINNPGRNFVINAGRDIINRARDNVDVTTTRGDIRNRADRNFHVLAGNGRDDKSGGILLESKAEVPTQDYSKVGEQTKSSGIVFMSKKAPIIGYGQEIYFGTTGEGGNAAGMPGVILDGFRGNRSVLAQGKEVIQSGERFIGTYTKSGKSIGKFYFSSPDLWYNDSHFLVVDGAIGSTGSKSGIFCDGPVLAKKQIITKQGVLAFQGIMTGGAVASKGGYAHVGTADGVEMVGKTSQDPVQTAINQVDESWSNIESSMEQMDQALNALVRVLDEYLSRDDSPAQDKLLNSVTFSLRTDEDYRVNEFVFYLSPWQMRLADGGTKWEEKPVKGTVGGNTFPYPGAKYYEGGEALRSVKQKLFEFDKGVSAKRGEDGGPYKGAKAEDDKKSTLQDWIILPNDKEM